MPERAPRHLVLVGLMGVGKSTVGAECAARLGRPLVDTDALVEAAAGATVSEIFDTEGEAGFRLRERVAVADACASPTPLVIACGGGAVLDAANRDELRRHGIVVWLRASPVELAARVGEDATRPLLAGLPRVETLERLAELRAPAYEAAANLVIDTDCLDADAVATRVLRELEQCG
jgi:shikimate kinase